MPALAAAPGGAGGSAGRGAVPNDSTELSADVERNETEGADAEGAAEATEAGVGAGPEAAGAAGLGEEGGVGSMSVS